MAKKRTEKLSDQIRRAIESCGKSRYRIWQETGIAQAILSRFMHGKGGLSTEALDKLGEALGLELVFRDETRQGR